MERFTVNGRIVDLEKKKIFNGTVSVENGKIIDIANTHNSIADQCIMPGFIDSHVHVESSMLVPAEFARLAVIHGTVATISDPHEIANVLGVEGVQYMIQNGSQVPFHFYFGAPSCVPATRFETAGAEISADQIDALFTKENLSYLSEMMNYPGVLKKDPEVMSKIKIAKGHGLPIDGHAPGLRGEDAMRYVQAGISTDHECFTLEEALDKLRYGMKIIIREGSAARNYEALHPLIKTHPDKIMFCSDDKHPNDLVEGHIDQLVKRSIGKYGYNMMDVLRAACFNPVKHYNLDVGLLKIGDSADFIVINNLEEFKVLKTYVKGKLVAEEGRSLIRSVNNEVINNFHVEKKTVDAFALPAKGEAIRIIKALDGELITESFIAKVKIKDNLAVSDPERDILKLAIINRYEDAPPAIAFIQGFGLRSGALASCIAHDSHNIIAVGVTDQEICGAVNAIIANKGGISVVDNERQEVLPLPVAGIMSPDDGFAVARSYSRLDQKAKMLGTKLRSPFMTLSFMALLVIPSLKLSDKGLFDGTRFSFTSLFVD